MPLQALAKYSVRIYSGLSCVRSATEDYRLWYRIDHYGSSQEGRPSRQAAGIGNRGADDRGSRSGLQRQQTDALPGDPQRQTQSLSTQQRLSDQTGRFAGVVRESRRDTERQGSDGYLSEAWS